MKRLFTLLSVLTMLILCFGGITVVAEEAGAMFSNTYRYVTEKPWERLPMTLEATFKFPADMPTDKRGGVVIGNYKNSDDACVNLEIYTDGVPRLYMVNDNGGMYDYRFEEVNVYTGEWVHLAVVNDATAGKVFCYVNGELKQIIEDESPKTITFENNGVLGGDLRTGNGQYFKGELQSVALFYDVRTAAEIADDKNEITRGTEGLMAFYEPDGKSEIVKDSLGNGPEFQREDWLIKDYRGVADYDYSFAVIGDIQTITYNQPEKLHYIYDWIVANAKDKKIAFVAGLGDMTDKDTDAEWELVKAEMAKLQDAGLSFSFVRGNHDSSGQFKGYFPYEEYKDTVDGCFKETMMNTYHKVNAGGVKYLFLNLDLMATDNILEWANEVIEEHKDYNVIITTHIYNSAKGVNYDKAAASSLDRYGMQNYPDVIWERVVSQHENISMVLCGHSPTDNVVVTQRKGVNGNTVTEMLVDPQTTDQNYDMMGLVAMLYFSDNGKKIDVEYYSTIKEGHFLEKNQFSVEVDVIPPAFEFPWWIAASAAIAVSVAALLILFLRKRDKE